MTENDSETREFDQEEVSSLFNWYAVRTMSGSERKVKMELERRIEAEGLKERITEVFLPTHEVMELKDGKREHVTKRRFPGYLLLRMVLDDKTRVFIKYTPGVTFFVGDGNDPLPMKDEEVDRLKEKPLEKKPEIHTDFSEGEMVKIKAGMFVDQIAKIEEINVNQNRVRVKIEIFSRETPVDLSLDEVEKL